MVLSWMLRGATEGGCEGSKYLPVVDNFRWDNWVLLWVWFFLFRMKQVIPSKWVDSNASYAGQARLTLSDGGWGYRTHFKKNRPDMSWALTHRYLNQPDPFATPTPLHYSLKRWCLWDMEKLTNQLYLHHIRYPLGTESFKWAITV